MKSAPSAPAVKLVVDTNLLVSGTLWSGAPARLINFVLSAPGTLCLSAQMVIELGEVLTRGEFAGRLAERHVTVSEIMLRYQRLSRWVSPAEISDVPSLRVPQDLKILAAAVGAGATLSSLATTTCWFSERSKASRSFGLKKH